MSQAQLERLWQQFDSDQNGFLDKDEALCLFRRFCRLQGLPPAQIKPQIQKMFKDFDADGDGQISFAEFMGWEGQNRDHTSIPKIHHGAAKEERLNLMEAQRLWRKYLIRSLSLSPC